MGSINWGALEQPAQQAPQQGAINWGAISDTKPPPAQNVARPPQQAAPQTNMVQDFASAAGHHLMNLPHGLAQLIENTVAKGASYLPDNPVSRAITSTAAQDNAAMQQREQQYQATTPDNGASYAGAALGEVAPFVYGAGAKAIQGIGNKGAELASMLLGKKAAMAAGGAAQGAAVGALQPVANGGDYWGNKGQQVGTDAAFGGVMPLAISGLAKVISPNPSAAYSTLAKSGVAPTIGQRLGGMFNTVEEKAQSLPFVGDMISQSRNRALKSFNSATLNDVVKPIGETVGATGHDGVAEAGDKLSNAYQSVLSKIKGVTFDDGFNNELSQLKANAENLTSDMANRFKSIVNDKFASRLSPVNGMAAETLKTASSDISALARKYSASSVASEQELGGALTQLDSMMNQQVSRSHPQYAPTLDAIDAGWAKLVRVEQAAKSAASNKVNTGVFTPSQLMQAVRSTDKSVRGRAVARGDALMQNWAQSGLQVLGDKVPNSGTFDRAANGAALIGALTHPEIGVPAAVGAGIGSLLYTQPAQKMAVDLATQRPAASKALAKALLKYMPSVTTP